MSEPSPTQPPDPSTARKRAREAKERAEYWAKYWGERSNLFGTVFALVDPLANLVLSLADEVERLQTLAEAGQLLVRYWYLNDEWVGALDAQAAADLLTSDPSTPSDPTP